MSKNGGLLKERACDVVNGQVKLSQAYGVHGKQSIEPKSILPRKIWSVQNCTILGRTFIVAAEANGCSEADAN